MVNCPHEATTLKTKNIYAAFDDTNGIDTIQHLVEKALTNTGWTIGNCDLFVESDGETQKVRSYSTEGKVGAYGMVSAICDLFNAYPVYRGDTKTVDIYNLKNKKPLSEMLMGKNLSSLSVEQNSENIVTRLYVEGEYGDMGYVGIDDVNPTGLSFLLNFDYYKEIGMFTAEHQAALDTYLQDIAAAKTAAYANSEALMALYNQLNGLIGQCKFVFYFISNGAVTDTALGGGASEDAVPIVVDDELVILKATGNYRTVTVEGGFAFASNDRYAFKFVTPTSASIGAKEVAVEAKEQLIAELQKDYERETDPVKKQRIVDQITTYQAEITELYAGNTETAGLYALMRQAAEVEAQIRPLEQQSASYAELQNQIEATFAEAMGDLLRDGYWSNNNYTIGQEQSLYDDAVDVLAQLSKPQFTYAVSLVTLSEAMGYTPDKFQLNTEIRLYDPDVPINDLVYVTKLSHRLDDPKKDTVEISNTDIELTGQGLTSVLSRITELADMVNQKNAMYSRARAIDMDGTLSMERLNGQIDILRNRLMSSTSSWYTDNDGNIIFEAVNGKAAMKLCGEGFCIANGKTESGEWNWRTFGTGEGFTADLITTGTLEASRIDVVNMDLNANQTFVAANAELDSRIQDTDGNLTQLYEDASEISLSGTKLGELFTELRVLVDGLQSQVTDLDGSYTQLQQDQEAFEAQVYTKDELAQYMTFSAEGLIIGSGTEDAVFHADNQTMDVTNIKTASIGIARHMDEAEDWIWVARTSGLGLKYVGP